MECKSCGDYFYPYVCGVCHEHPAHCKECHAEIRHGIVPGINSKNMVSVGGRMQEAVSAFHARQEG